MRWPSSRDYNEAVQDPSFSFKDADLRAAEATTNAHGLPIARSGGFADVYQLRAKDGKSWAVKCFTKEVSELHRRYQAISEHLAAAREKTTLRFMVDFKYLDDELRIGSDRYPVLKMTWVEGKLLHDFVRAQLDNPTLLEKLSAIWHKLGQNLRAAKMAHGDLQHGNVLLVPTDRGGVVPQLIDYDGMYVPALDGVTASEIGHANYQHPGRDADRFHFEMDRFPLLLIYTAIRCLGVGGRKLWEKFDSGDNLLFKEADIKNPQNSALCKELWGLPDPAARALAGWVILASRMPLREVPLLDDIIGTDGKRKPTLTAKQEAEVRQLLFPGSRPPPIPDPVPEPLPEPSWWTDERIQKIKYAAVGWVILLVAAFGISTLFKKPAPKPDETAKAPAQASPGSEPPKKVATLPAKSPTPWRAGAVLKNDAGQVKGVAISADGKRAIAGVAESVQVWELETGMAIHRFEGVGNVSRVALSGDGKRAISWSPDRSLRFFDVENRKELNRFELQSPLVYALALSADGKRAVCGDNDAKVLVWNLETGKELYSLAGHTQEVAGVAIAADGKLALSASSDKRVGVWNLETGDNIRFLEGHTAAVSSVSITPDGKRGISGGHDKSIRVWNLDTGKSIHELTGHTHIVSAVGITADGK